MVTTGEKVEKQENKTPGVRSGREVGKGTKWKPVESQGRGEKAFLGENCHLS